MSVNATPAFGPIRVLRKEAGMSQEQLARLADCSTGYVRVLEAGYMPASPEGAPAYARVLQALNDERAATKPRVREDRPVLADP